MCAEDFTSTQQLPVDEPIYFKTLTSHAIETPDVTQENSKETVASHSGDFQTSELKSPSEFRPDSPNSRAPTHGHVSELALRHLLKDSSSDYHEVPPEATSSAAVSAIAASTSTVSTAVPSARGAATHTHGGHAMGGVSPASSRSPFPSPAGVLHASGSPTDRRTSDGSQPSMQPIPQPGEQISYLASVSSALLFVSDSLMF